MSRRLLLDLLKTELDLAVLYGYLKNSFDKKWNTCTSLHFCRGKHRKVCRMLSVPHPLHLVSFNDCLLHTQYTFLTELKLVSLGMFLKMVCLSDISMRCLL